MNHVKQFKSWKAFDAATEKDGVPFTNLVGYIEASPAELVRLFGEPCKCTSLYDDKHPSPKEFWAKEERVIFNVGSHGSHNDSAYTVRNLLDLIQTRKAERKAKENVA
jgi:hypothetical protein